MKIIKRSRVQTLILACGVIFALAELFYLLSSKDTTISQFLYLLPLLLLIPAYLLDDVQNRAESYARMYTCSFAKGALIFGAALSPAGITSEEPIGIGFLIFLLIYGGFNGMLATYYKEIGYYRERGTDALTILGLRKKWKKEHTFNVLHDAGRFIYTKEAKGFVWDQLIDLICEVSYSDFPEGKGLESRDYPFSEKFIYDTYLELQGCRNAEKLNALSRDLLDHYQKTNTTEVSIHSILPKIHPEHQAPIEEKIQAIIKSCWETEDGAFKEMSHLFKDNDDMSYQEDLDFMDQYDRFMSSYPNSSHLPDVHKAVISFLEYWFEGYINNSFDEDGEPYDDFHVEGITADSGWADDKQALDALSIYTDEMLPNLNIEGQIKAVGLFRKFIGSYLTSRYIRQVRLDYIRVLRYYTGR